MINFDFTETFRQIGQMFCTRFRQAIEQQVDLAGKAYARPALSTLKARERLLAGTTLESRKRMFKALKLTKGETLKGKGRTAKGSKHVSTPLTRMYVTHDTAIRGFQFEAQAKGVTVFVPDTPHIPVGGKTTSLSKIIQYNSQGQPRLNPRVGGKAPLIFPANSEQLQAMPEMKRAKMLFDAAVQKKLNELAKAKVVRQISIG
jgi:hypothetical protein